MAQILFIDDDPDTLATLQKAVELFGHRAILASSADEAFRVLEEEVTDLVVTDVALPDIDGINLVRKLRARGIFRDLPVIVYSASQELDMNTQVQAAGAQAFIQKPIRLQDLREIIEQLTSPQFASQP